VSRPTVRKAVDELIEAGFIVRVPGKGLIVGPGQPQGPQSPLLFLIPYVPDDGLFYNMVMGCIDAANECACAYKILNVSSATERLEAVKQLNLSDYAGVVLTAYENEADYALVEWLHHKACPAVLVDNPLSKANVPYVITNDYMGGHLAGTYLVERGHRDILYLTIDTENHTVTMRKKGFLDALKAHGIRLPVSYIMPLQSDAESPEALRNVSVAYSAICGYSDLPIIFAYEQLISEGKRVPEDISLIGYGNFRYGEMLRVPLTTIHMPVYEMGCEAVYLLLKLIRGLPAESRILDVYLIERASVLGHQGRF
jgi:DNA-binding LacI/PurR family transcriptional regulator